MRHLPAAIVVVIASTALAAAQPAPPAHPPHSAAMPGPAAPPPGGPDVDMPRPPDGPRSDRPPPPQRGAAIHVERTVDGALRLDVRCAEREVVKDCADVAYGLLDKLNAMTRK